MLATVPMMAREVGRRRNSVRDLRRTVRQGLWVAVLVALPIWALLWNGERILLAMGQEPALARDAGHYLRTLQWGLLPFFLYVVLRSFIASLERPGWATVVAFIGVIINLVGNLVLVFGHLGFPEMGIVGSGLATSIANFSMFIGMILVVTLDRRFRRYRLFGRFWRADWQRLRQLLWLGLPIAAMMAFETTLFNAAALMMGLIGASSLAAYAVVIQLCSVSFMIPLGINQAATVRVGIAYGSHDPEAIARAGWTSYAMGVGFMALSALVMMTLPRLLLSAFIDVDSPANAEVVMLATGFLAVAALFQIVDGAQAVAAGMLRGLQRSATGASACRSAWRWHSISASMAWASGSACARVWLSLPCCFWRAGCGAGTCRPSAPCPEADPEAKFRAARPMRAARPENRCYSNSSKSAKRFCVRDCVKTKG
jgi:MATE family multidrug resistance protein